MQENNTQSVSDRSSEAKLKKFHVLRIDGDRATARTYSRKDFYKICLTTGKSAIHYTDRSYEAEGTVLFFGNPHVPYSWDILTSDFNGYSCLFSADLLKVSDRDLLLQRSPFFRSGGTPILNITDDQHVFLRMLFEKMITEQKSEYIFKDDLIRNYINLIIHEAVKMQPSDFDNRKNAASRITAVFLDLLESQFPVESPDKPISLKIAQDYARYMSVHVNYLNRMVKETTGNPTSNHITGRIIVEAKALLQHTDWTVSDIAYALGFDYPSYFNNYFKRMTGTNPKAFRASQV